MFFGTILSTLLSRVGFGNIGWFLIPFFPSIFLFLSICVLRVPNCVCRSGLIWSGRV
jgi:hypothetical protein